MVPARTTSGSTCLKGPFPTISAFRDYLDKRSKSDDPLSFSIVDIETGRALGHASYMRISPEHRVVEVGNIFLTQSFARTRGATEAMYLMAKHVFEDLGYRRYEWKCNALNMVSRRAALRLGFAFEGYLCSSYDSERPIARYGLVFNPRR